MKFLSVFLLAVTGIVATAESPWKLNQEYRYDIYSRTFSGLPDLKNQYVGIVTKGNLVLQVESNELIVGRIMNMKHSHYHDELDKDWNLETAEKNMDYQEYDLNDKSFLMHYKNGVLQSIHVDSTMTNDQVNQLKAILSQLQIVSDEKYMIRRPYNQMPENNRNPQASYTVMEPTITGECETIYDIGPVPHYLVQDLYADWVFDKTKMNSASINSNEKLFQIVKTMNYSNCHLSRGYHYGITGSSNLKPNTNQMGDFITKSSVTKILARGNWNDFSIQNSYTTNRVLVSPVMYQNEQAEVMSQIQLTMTENQQVSQKLEKPSQMINAGDLVYRYNRPSDPDNKVVSDNDDDKYLQNYEDIISTRVRRSTRQEIRTPFSSYSNQKPSWYTRSLPDSNNEHSSHSSAEHENNIKSYYQPMPTMKDAPEIPLYHYTVGNQGRSIQSDEKSDFEKEVLKLVNEISEDVQSQNDIPKRDTLQKFDILSDLVRTMNLQQIDNVYKKLQNSNEENENISQTLARKTFQDAVAVAGTGPAVRSVLRWISERQIKKREAQSLLEDIMRNIRYPTEEMMKEIFEFVRSEPVEQNRDLYSVAIISYTNVLRRAFNERSSRNRYPVNAFGSSDQDIEQFVAKEIIPYLSSRLQQSVEQKNGKDILLYLRSIGNLGHHEIVRVYEEYLEDNKKLTSFQRTALVLSLDRLTKSHPRLARNILFKILTNIADEPETRSVAILLLMNADPTVAMLQRMAEMSNNDPSEAVQSMAKSAIESAANLKSPRHINLANNAKNVRHMLNPRRFGNEYSRTYLSDYIAREMNLVHEHQITHILGEDNVTPKGILYNVRKNYGGFETKTTELQAMVSNIEELLKFLPNVKSEGHDHTKTANDDQSGEWSIHRVAKQLHMEPEIMEQLEGQILFRMLGRENFMSFDEESLKMLPQKLVSQSKLFKDGEQIRYNRMYNRKQIVIAFPLATGYPFIYTFSMPTLIQAIGHVQMKTTPDIGQNPSWETIRSLQSLNIAVKTHLVFSTDQIAKVGFITPFDRQRYVAGNVKKSYVHLPLDMKVDLDMKHNKMSGKVTPIEPNQNFNMIEASSWPFTLRKDVFDLRPAAEARDLKLIVSSHPYVQNRVIGEKSTGMVFDLHSEHHFSSKDRTNMFKTLWNQGIRSLLKSPSDYKNLMEKVLSHQKPSFWSFIPHTYMPSSYHNTKRNVLLNMISLPYLNEFNLDEFIKMQGLLSLINFPFTDFDTLQATESNSAILQTGSLPWPSRTLNHYRFYIMYDASRSANQIIKFSFALDKAYNPNEQSTYRPSNRMEGPSSLDEKKLSIPQDLSPNSQERRQQFLYNAAHGVKQASAAVLDASLVFDGNKKTEYIATVSHAHSPVDEKSRVLIFLNAKPIKPSAIQQIGMSLVAKNPKRPMLSFEDALKQNDKSSMKAYIILNNEGQTEPTHINIKVNMEQTDKYRNYLTRENPAGKRCLKEIQAGKNQPSSCLDATYKAGLQDRINLQADIDNSNNQVQKIIQDALRITEKVGFWNLERYENNKSLKSNRVETTFDIMPAMNAANLSIEIEDKKYFFRELPFDKSLLSLLNNANLHYDSREDTTEDQHTCVADRNRIITFDKNVLDTELTKCWYAMVQTKVNKQSTPSSSQREISILVRNNGSQQKELMVIVAQKTGKDHVIRLFGNSKIQINGQEKKSSTGATLDVFDDNSNEPSIRVYQQVKGENVIQIGEYLVNVYFNGDTIKIHMDPKYRGNTYGLCGTFTGEKFDDYITPQKCVLRNNRLFTASWAIEDNNCSNEIRSIKTQAQRMPCSKLEYYSGKFVTETETKTRQNHSEWIRHSNPSPYDSSEEIYKRRNQQERNYSQENQMKCNMREQIQFIENHEKICFTIDALPACPKHCTAQRKTERKAQVYCRNKDDSVAQLYKQQILKGANPDFSSKSVTKTVAFNVPTSCIAVH